MVRLSEDERGSRSQTCVFLNLDSLASPMQNESVTRLIESAWDQPERLSELEKFRRNLAVMFTDIKGSTAYFEKYGDAAGLAMVYHCNERLRKIVEEHGGVVVKTIGDAIMATFPGGECSVRAAVKMQKSLTAMNQGRPAEDHVFIRIGINYGPGIVRSNHDVFGDVVNVAARLESLAQPEQIVVSGALRDQVAPLEAFETAHLGRYHLKGKSGDCDVYEVMWSQKHIPLPKTTCLRIPTAGVSAPAAYALVHIREDGSSSTAREIGSQAVIVGRTCGAMKFPADAALADPHARFSLQNGEIEVELLSANAQVFVQLIGPYCLQDSDRIIVGSHVFELRTGRGHEGSSLPPALIVVRGENGNGGRALPLTECMTLGRLTGTCIFPDDKVMSRTHAKVYRRANDFFVEDLGSRNGTFLGVRGSMLVPPQALILMGTQRFRVEPR